MGNDINHVMQRSNEIARVAEAPIELSLGIKVDQFPDNQL